MVPLDRSPKLFGEFLFAACFGLIFEYMVYRFKKQVFLLVDVAIFNIFNYNRAVNQFIGKTYVHTLRQNFAEIVSE